MDNIPERVKFVRKSAHLSQVEFGARLSVTGSAISNIEAGTRAITERMKLYGFLPSKVFLLINHVTPNGIQHKISGL